MSSEHRHSYHHFIAVFVILSLIGRMCLRVVTAASRHHLLVLFNQISSVVIVVLSIAVALVLNFR